jgi:hypothetical protein
VASAKLTADDPESSAVGDLTASGARVGGQTTRTFEERPGDPDFALEVEG